MSTVSVGIGKGNLNCMGKPCQDKGNEGYCGKVETVQRKSRLSVYRNLTCLSTNVDILAVGKLNVYIVFF